MKKFGIAVLLLMFCGMSRGDLSVVSVRPESGYGGRIVFTLTGELSARSFSPVFHGATAAVISPVLESGGFFTALVPAEDTRGYVPDVNATIRDLSDSSTYLLGNVVGQGEALCTTVLHMPGNYTERARLLSLVGNVKSNLTLASITGGGGQPLSVSGISSPPSLYVTEMKIAVTWTPGISHFNLQNLVVSHLSTVRISAQDGRNQDVDVCAYVVWPLECSQCDLTVPDFRLTVNVPPEIDIGSKVLAPGESTGWIRADKGVDIHVGSSGMLISEGVNSVSVLLQCSLKEANVISVRVGDSWCDPEDGPTYSYSVFPSGGDFTLPVDYRVIRGGESGPISRTATVTVVFP